ncbi:hypothetical protein GPECTOR_13g685 [Gonium pectorale]|uniref:Auxin efflux carrier family n=1 Tax=Gonium pectorale TaxID=33097 RepID=A0A150GN44_GONPE|nr:hypothetical protein GPECTOR_13g685 [Gonium pectorale]|eukprot:KXZ51198.1 hypothetical protein GPECTOR_13g685 [Gonium pectorale]
MATSDSGLLNADGRRVLSTLTLHVFTPCLLFSKLAVGSGVGELVRCWVISANMVASHVVGLLLGLLAVRAAAVPARLRNQVVLCCGVGNVGNLPFMLLAGLAADPGLPFAAALGPAGAAELAMRYVALSNLTAALIQFPLTHAFLQQPAQQQQQQQQELAAPKAAVLETPHPAAEAASRQPAQPPQPPLPSPSPPSPWRALAAGVLSPPTLASVAGVLVASCEGLQATLFSPTGCLRLVGELADGLGAVCIPLLLLVLGANLAAGPGVAAGRLPPAAALATVATRLLVLPAVCGAALLAAWGAGHLPGTDPLAVLVMLVMHATPTAVLVHSMATIFSNAEDEVAALLFWQYAASLVSLPVAIGAALATLGPAAAVPGAWAGLAAAAAAVTAA